MIPDQIATDILRNCGGLSVVAMLNCAEVGLTGIGAFDIAFERLGQESANGTLWPAFLEWMTRQWPRFGEVAQRTDNGVITAMADTGVTLFDQGRLTQVFAGVDQANFGSVPTAIESRVSLYDGDDEAEDTDEEF
jgi:hypothetical protein